MIAILMRRAFAALAMLAMLGVAVEANAACCGGGAASAFYPSAYSASYPSSYNTYYAGSYSAYSPTYSTGWYPGYYWDRIRARVWGSPSTYVAAYPTTAY